MYRGTQTTGSWEARLARYADALSRAVTDNPGPPDPAAVVECRARLRDLDAHALRHAFPEVLSRAEAAARLLGWLASSPRLPADPAALATIYRDDLSFADWARDRISGGEAGAGLSVAYRLLEEASYGKRTQFNRQFAAALASGDLPGTLPVEKVLDAALLPPLKEGHRVLLVLLDGLSWAVAHELLPDIRRHGWQELTWLSSGEPPPALLAAVPSVTEFSRASLFCGQLTRGDASAERAGFAAHQGLAAVCDRKHPPVLFHKATVTEGPRGALHNDVRQAVLSEKAKAVAVVVNAIDDELSGAEQIRGQWVLDAIRPLAALLQAARDGGRLVVLAGDHGHVWHRDRAEYRRVAEAGERWRPAGGSPGPGEIVMRGPRVQGGVSGNGVIVPWDEAIRYGVAKKGYHGGVTLQEMLAPLLVLTHEAAPARKGLYRCRLTEPEWWVLAPDALPPVHEPATLPSVRRPTGSLLDLLPDGEAEHVLAGSDTANDLASSAAGWVDRLLRSDVLREQKAAAGKHLPTDTDVRRCLEALDAAGGTLTCVGLSRQAAVPVLQMDGVLAKLQRLLNMDGYEVLRVDRTADQVTLNLPLLLRQFELV
jgi:hypothetical protein